MKLLLAVCLTCAVLYRAESLRCHMCANSTCSTPTSIECPAQSTVCQSVTLVWTVGPFTTVAVFKNCSSLLSCVTPLALETEWSVNLGFVREARNQICCISDNCNFKTLATPSTLPNGKQCPACASPADSLAGTCNTTLSCVGAEDRCFSGTTKLYSTEVLRLGCMSRNLCNIQAIVNALFGADSSVTCGAPWSLRISAMLLTSALTVHKVLV